MTFVLRFHPSSACCLSPTTEAADSCSLCNLIPFELWQISLPKCWIGKLYTAYIDILIGTSHQAHCRFFVCPATPWIAAWSPWWILISPTAEPADSCTLCNLIPFEWKNSLLKGGIGKSYTGTPVTSASCHSTNQASSCWVQSLPSKCSVIGAGHGPSSNICCQHNYFK